MCAYGKDAVTSGTNIAFYSCSTHAYYLDPNDRYKKSPILTIDVPNTYRIGISMSFMVEKCYKNRKGKCFQV